MFGAEIWTLRKADQNYLEIFEIVLDKNEGQFDRVKNEVLHTLKEERKILYKTERWNACCVGHTLLRNCLLKHVIQ
jgi:hypothetical protein